MAPSTTSIAAASGAPVASQAIRFSEDEPFAAGRRDSDRLGIDEGRRARTHLDLDHGGGVGGDRRGDREQLLQPLGGVAVPLGDGRRVEVVGLPVDHRRRGRRQCDVTDGAGAEGDGRVGVVCGDDGARRLEADGRGGRDDLGRDGRCCRRRLDRGGRSGDGGGDGLDSFGSGDLALDVGPLSCGQAVGHLTRLHELRRTRRRCFGCGCRRSGRRVLGLCPVGRRTGRQQRRDRGDQRHHEQSHQRASQIRHPQPNRLVAAEDGRTPGRRRCVHPQVLPRPPARVPQGPDLDVRRPPNPS